jgi:hypothetical protein
MDERLRFVARLLEGEKMAPLCAEFGISRKTGYKIFDRYKRAGTPVPSHHHSELCRHDRVHVSSEFALILNSARLLRHSH